MPSMSNPSNRMPTPATDQGTLTSLLERWMALNDIRWILLTIMWLVMMYYFVSKGKLNDALEGSST